MSKDPIYPDPSRVTARAGVVHVEGPDHVHVALTPEAAIETGARLIEKAAEAHGDALVSAELARRKANPPS